MRAARFQRDDRFRRPSELAGRFDVSRLDGHFVLGRSLPVEPESWRRREVDGWILLHDRSLPALDLVDSEGAVIGWVLGHLLDLDASTLVTQAVRAPAVADRSGLEDWLYGHGGRFVAVVLRPTPSLYPDAAASLPVFVDPRLEAASSSPFLLASPDEGVPDSDLVDALDVFRTGSWFPLGATPHARATRLLPNHMVDLVSWRQSRRWPTTPLEPDEPSASVERIAATIERTMAAAASSPTPNVGFTAGGDSRTFLACSRTFLDRLRFFTVAFPDELGKTDLRTAPRLAQNLDLEYRVLPWRTADDVDVELFMYRTGCAVGELRGRIAGPSYEQLAGTGPYVSGVGAEMARGIGWRGSDRRGMRLGPDDILARFGFAPHPELLSRAEAWLSELPGLDALDALTLFHFEMRFGCWGGSLTTAYPDAYTFTLYPYGHRAIIDGVLRLPTVYRASGRMRDDLIATRWPELSAFGVNRRPPRVRMFGGLRRGVHLTRHGLSLGAGRARSHVDHDDQGHTDRHA